MQKPRIWVWLMVGLSALAFFGNGSVTVMTGGLISIPSAIVVGIFVTSLPMLALLYLDRAGVKRRGESPPSAFWSYFFVILLPSYLFTPAYLVFRASGTEEPVQSINEGSVGSEVYSEVDEELPPLHESSWSESDLKNLSQTSYHSEISEMIRQDLKDDGVEFTEHERGDGGVLFRSKDNEMSTFPVRLDKDRITSIEDGTEVVEQILDEYADETGLLIAYTDTQIEPEVCTNLVDRHGVFLVPEKMTRRNLELYS